MRTAAHRCFVENATNATRHSFSMQNWACQRRARGFSRQHFAAQGKISERVLGKIGANLHKRPQHPLHIILKTIELHFQQDEQPFDPKPFKFFDSLPPQVSVSANFDSLLIPEDHVSRAPTDTFYLDADTVLRTHTSAHQVELMQQGHTAFLCTGDVYRRDTVDRSHYPVFHQTEGVKIFDCWGNGEEACDHVESDMKRTLDGLAVKLFGPDTQTRWNIDDFPFTHPSWEMEVLFEGEWLEVLGCGVVKQDILNACGHGDKRGWAFGLGLERLAMILFDIPDIRLFWTEDSRFHSQFANVVPGDHSSFPKFRSYSKYPECYKDVSFWLPKDSSYHENAVHELVREVVGDLVEEVVLVDTFAHPQTGKTSHCFRINYRATDRVLTNEEVDHLQWKVREKLATELLVELR